MDRAAHHVGCKAGAFFIGEEGHCQGASGLDAGVIEGFNDLQPGQNAQAAVIDPAGTHGIDMRTDHDRRAVFEAGADAGYIADAVDREFQAKVAHPAGDQVASLAILGAQGQPAATAPFQRANCSQRFETAQQAS